MNSSGEASNSLGAVAQEIPSGDFFHFFLLDCRNNASIHSNLSFAASISLYLFFAPKRLSFAVGVFSMRSAMIPAGIAGRGHCAEIPWWNASTPTERSKLGKQFGSSARLLDGLRRSVLTFGNRDTGGRFQFGCRQVKNGRKRIMAFWGHSDYSGYAIENKYNKIQYRSRCRAGLPPAVNLGLCRVDFCYSLEL
jgi:hypothetical protein